jgi:hypothetical protein
MKPRHRTLWLIITVVFGIIALILAIDAAASWNDAQSVSAALIGAQNNYTNAAIIQGIGACLFGTGAAVYAHTYRKSGEKEKEE